MDQRHNDTTPEKAEAHYARLYADLILAADNLDPGLVHKWIMEWGDLDAPVLGGRTILERVLEEQSMPNVERFNLVRSLLLARASPPHARTQAVVQDAEAELADHRHPPEDGAAQPGETGNRGSEPPAP